MPPHQENDMRTKMIPMIGLLPLFLLNLCSCTQYKIKVDAGQFDRQNTPVWASIDLGKDQMDAQATIQGSGEASAAQPFFAAPEKMDAQLYWILPELNAGQSQTVTARIGACSADKIFTWKDSSTDQRQSRDLYFGDKPVLRYQYTAYDPQRIDETRMPFYHVFSPDGSRLITKGPGGVHSHHRGIFFGYKKCIIDGEVVANSWYNNEGEHQQHQTFLRQYGGPVMGGHTVRIFWTDRQGHPIVEEFRKIRAYRQPEDQILIEFESTLQPVDKPVELIGDRQHAGVHIRAANEIADEANQAKTRFIRPALWSHLPANEQINTEDHKGLPWYAMQYELDDQVYTVAYLSDPGNPPDEGCSERLYGRIGEYFPWHLGKDTPLHIRYRFWITTGEVTRDRLEGKYHDLAEPPDATVAK